MNLILFVVRYKLYNTCIRQHYEWKRIYFSREQAEQFAKTVPESDFISITEEPTNSPIFTEARDTPYRYLHGEYITLGDYRNSKVQYQTTAYTSKELFEVAKLEFDREIAEERKRQDAYYSQPWV